LSKPEHVAVLERLDEGAGRISVFEYGQCDAKQGKPAGRLPGLLARS